MNEPLSIEQVHARGHTVWAEIDLASIRHNIRVLAGLAPSSEVMGVVKGYAYGHGNPASAQAMVEAGVSRLGVARVAEALHLRAAGIAVPIHVFSEPGEPSAPAIVEQGLTAAVYTEAFAQALSDAAAEAGTRVPVHLKLDTGMHRVGIMADDVDDAVRALGRLPGIDIEGAWSHLAVADVPDHPFTRRQLDLFALLTDKIEGAGVKLRYKHIANSAAVLSLPEAHLDMIRCGIASYGLWPGAEMVGRVPLRPALALKARVTMVKSVPAGERLSYGLRYELERPGTVITVGCGYADGYDRRLSGTADVLIEGDRHRVSGTVCMDQFMVDTAGASVAPGEVVTLIGSSEADAITVEELAGLIGTINYEVTTRIPSRVPRIYLDGER